jgi:LPXTG-motif cell wall-anchored protein
MKKALLTISVFVLLSIGSLSLVRAQDQPAPKKDTVNMDTYAKPENYYSTEDEKHSKKSGSGTTIGIIAGAVVVVAGAGYFLLRKKEK